MGFPSKSCTPLGAFLMVVQELKNCFALLARHLIDMRGKSLVDVEKLSATLGVADYNRVIRLGCACAELTRTIMVGREPLQICLHIIRQRVIRAVHTCKAWIAAAIRRQGMQIEYACERRDRRTGLIGMPHITRHTWRFPIGVELTHPEVVCRLAIRLLTHMLS